MIFKPSSLRSKLLVSLALGCSFFAGQHLVVPQQAEACGCFVPPDPTVPIVQAGERILFAMDQGEVTAHIQVQYSGPAEEFGWLLPMPSVPEMELGTEELFAQLIAQTQPTYRLDREYKGDCPFDPNRGIGDAGSPAPSSDSGESGGGGDGDSPLVLRASIGPYDYAVLKADSKQPMLDWLETNGFFVPTGTEDVVDPYIHPKGYFLALKLLKGNDVGDLQPVVLRYQSELPMIPIILTSVAANPNMGVQVWVLGESRAIPRNYHHTKINDAAIDWLNAGANYADVVTKAVDEIEGHHSFVTEYAGTSNVMLDILDYPGRFGNNTELAQRTGAIEFVEYLNQTGFAVFANSVGWSYSSTTLNVLDRHLPVPAKLLAQDVTASQYYFDIGYYLGDFREKNPELFEDLDIEFDSEALALELQERVVAPTQGAGQLFRENPYLSRLFTTLSPNEMTKDPAFSFNPDLPEVGLVHTGVLTYLCHLIADPTIETTPATLLTEQGFKLTYENGTGFADAENKWTTFTMPQSQFQEILREEGAPEVVQDNTAAIRAALSDGRGGGGSAWGCAAGGSGSGVGVLWLGLALFFVGRHVNRNG